MTKPNTSKGFTLVELMIIIVIIGILGNISIASYNKMTASSRRQDGSSDLYTVMYQQERYYLNNSRYAQRLGLGGLGYTVNAAGSVVSPKGYYTTSTAFCEDINGIIYGNTTRCIRLEANAQNPDDPDFWLQSDGQKSELMP